MLYKISEAAQLSGQYSQLFAANSPPPGRQKPTNFPLSRVVMLSGYMPFLPTTIKKLHETGHISYLKNN